MTNRDLEALAHQPLLLSPNRVPRSYRGGALLDRLQGITCPQDTFFPEDWVGSTTTSRMPGRPTDEGLSLIISPEGGSYRLHDLIQAFPEAMLGEKHLQVYGTELAVLCKLLDAAMRLPLQVHPNAAFAQRFLNSKFGKTECWVVIGTRVIGDEEPHVLLGFRAGVTDQEFRRVTMAQETSAQLDMLHRIAVQPGNVYLVPAGTPHAIGPGVFLVEVQEPTDLTISVEYLFAGNLRSAEQCFLGLGFDLAMQCFDYKAAGMDFVQRCTLRARPFQEDSGGREELLVDSTNTSCFKISRLMINDNFTWFRDRRACLVLVIQGEGHLRWQEGQHCLRPGASFFMPAACEEVVFQYVDGDALTVLACFPPAHPTP